MKKPLTLSEKLKSYSIITGSLLAASAAQGQVIYTDVIPDAQVGGIPPASLPDTASYALDLNNDGITDFNLILRITAVDTKMAGYSFSEYMTNAHHSNNFIGTLTVLGYHPFVRQFKKGDTINLNANNQGQVGIFFYQIGATNPSYGWDNIKDHYIGLHFIGSDDSLHYGWLRVDVNTNDSVPNIIIKDYAYEQTPNKSIAAGDGIISSVVPVEDQNGIILFPNPSSGNCFIKVEKPLSGNVQLLVKDELGQEVFASNVEMKTNSALPFDFSKFPAGIYYITVKSETVSLTRKWMKN
jgi:Secretion system C-terminal sorting domain